MSILLTAAPGSIFAGLEKYIAIWIISVFISSVAQIMLKVEANKKHESRLKEYLNPMVVGSYAIFFLSTFLTMYALKFVPLSFSPIIESTSYIFIPLFGVFMLREKITRRRWIGIGIILVGILIFTL